MWEEAGKARRKRRSNTIKHVHIDANDIFKQIKNNGLVLSYNCPNCGGNLTIDGNVELKYCTYCGSAVNVKDLSRIMENLLD